MGDDPRDTLRQLWDRLRFRWGAAIRTIDLDRLTDREVRVLIDATRSRIRALIEGEAAGWQPHDRGTP